MMLYDPAENCNAAIVRWFKRSCVPESNEGIHLRNARVVNGWLVRNWRIKPNSSVANTYSMMTVSSYLVETVGQVRDNLPR